MVKLGKHEREMLRERFQQEIKEDCAVQVGEGEVGEVGEIEKEMEYCANLREEREDNKKVSNNLPNRNLCVVCQSVCS